MFFLSKRTQYDYLILPLEKSIYDLTPAQARRYFEWYMEQLPQRVAYVARVCAKELHIPESRMDCSPESLIPLWRWLRKRAKTELSPCPGDPKRKVLTTETELILLDVGMYLGETMHRNIPGLQWSYYTQPKKDFFCNHPLLTGFVDMTSGQPFQAVFEPIHMAKVQATKLLRHASQSHDLYDLYELWAKKAP